MKFLKIAVLFSAFIIFNASDIYAQQTARYRLGITYASSLYSNKESFEFTIDSGPFPIGQTEAVILNSANPKIYFSATFGKGEKYSIKQISGARTCNFSSDKQGIFNNQDIIVTVDCGTPPLTIFKLEVTGVEQGEFFKFADNYGRTLVISFSATINAGGFPMGDDYIVTQTDGPRQCKMSQNQGVVPATPITVKADCSKNPTGNPPSPTNSFPAIDLVSRSTDNNSLGTFYDSNSAVIGGKGEDEGRYVAFVSSAPGLGGSLGKYRQIIWRDRKTGETRLVSATANGGEGNQASFAPAISADGRSVAFESYATNLVPVDTNGVRDVFVWNADTNKVSAVSENRGTEANSECFEPTISADGNLIAFSSSASNLTSGVEGTSTVNVYLRDMQSGAVTLISKSEKTGKGGGGSNPSISEDGRRIAFYNYFPLTKEDQNDLWDIYVWENGSPKLKRISKTASGGDKDQGKESASRVVAPSISGNGKFVAFATTATNMVADDTNKLQDVFVAEIDSGRIIRASVGENNTQGDDDSPVGQGEKIAVSFDGRWVAFSTKAKNLGGNILMKNVQSNQILKISTDVDSSVGQPAMSRNGGFLIFGSNLKLDSRFQSSGIFTVITGVSF